MENNLPCETCAYYDENAEDGFTCLVNFDEDEISGFYGNTKATCPYYRFYDEYKMVQKQN